MSFKLVQENMDIKIIKLLMSEGMMFHFHL